MNTRWQQELNIVDSSEYALNEWADMTGSEPDKNIEDFITNSANTLEWIESFDIEFETVQPDICAGSIPRIHSLSSTSSHPLTLWTETLLPYTKLNQTVVSIEKSSEDTLSSKPTQMSTPLSMLC